MVNTVHVLRRLIRPPVTGKSYHCDLTNEANQAVPNSIGTERLIDRQDGGLSGMLRWTDLRRAELCRVRVKQYPKAVGYEIMDNIDCQGRRRDWLKVGSGIRVDC